MNKAQRNVIIATLFILAALLVVPVPFDYGLRWGTLPTTAGRLGGFMESDYFRVALTVTLVAAGLVILLGKAK